MERIKPVLGVVLIIAAVFGMIFWEKFGREMVFSREVLISERDIMIGESLKADDFKCIAIEKNAIMKGAFTKKELSRLKGSVARGFIAKGQQINAKHVQDAHEYIDGRSFFLLKPEWIYSRSSSLRKGDIVRIVSAFGNQDFGEFEVAFVKDLNEKEIVDMSSDGEIMAVETPEHRERKNPATIPDHVEILAKLDDYNRIAACAENGEALILMQVI